MTGFFRLWFVVLFILPGVSMGQDLSKVDLDISFRQLQPLAGSENYYIGVETGGYRYRKPSILSHITRSVTGEMKCLYHLRSGNYMPGLIVRYAGYTFKQDEFYKNIRLSTLSFGLAQQLKLLRNKRFTLMADCNLSFGFSSLQYDRSEPVITYSDEIDIQLNYPAYNGKFLNPSIDLGGSIYYALTERVGLNGLAGLSLIHFPDFESESPLFFTTMYLGIGIRYELIKNKRFLYTL